MVVWLVAGLGVGWLSSRRLDVGGLAIFLIAGLIVPIAACAVARRVDVAVLSAYATFWAAVQAGYLAAAIGRERTTRPPAAGAEVHPIDRDD